MGELMTEIWVVLKTQPRRELLAAHAVRARGAQAYVPMLPPKRRDGLATPLFPGYLFAHVELDSDDLVRIRSAPGIAYVLPRASAPAFIPNEVIDAIRRRLGDPTDGVIHPQFKPGQRVTIVEGPFKWVEAVVDRNLSAVGRVRVLLDFVHRLVPAVVDEEAIKLVG
jgi:transcription antitermination factor NusG